MADDDLLFELVGDIRAVKSRLNDELAAAAGERHELVAIVDSLASSLREMRSELDATSADFLTSPWWWPRLCAEEARKAWDVLCPWVDELIERYDAPPRPEDGKPPSGRRIRSCWFAHDDVLDALSALYWAWLGAYKSRATPVSPIEWQERWLRQTLELVERVQSSCTAGCTELEKRPGEIRMLDREAYIGRDVKARPSKDED